ncbi:FAD-binding domain protein [Mycena kentingensis (nom. inval.)]|nr:FAD-binding domain protein [Mycena kentingensis (nom. inval.)]
MGCGDGMEVSSSRIKGASEQLLHPPMHNLLPLTTLLFAAVAQGQKCTFGQACWPSTASWTAFNSTIGGRLIAPRPPASVCHAEEFDAVACEEAKTNWFTDMWRATKPGAYADLLWENGAEECFIDSNKTAPCEQGLVPVLATAAQGVSDIQESVKFAAKNNLLLVVKNTGHDFLGRSSGDGSFAIWTHNLKGIEFTDAFRPAGCPANTTSGSNQTAVTVQPGEHWIDVYKAADEHGVVVVGGATRSVGAAGGWVLGGGHSALGHLYGMGVDNVLQFTVVTADGEHRTANACQNSDLFWALRGGGGSAFGVLTSVTYKTHPALENVVITVASWNGATAERTNAVSASLVKLIPSLSTSGWSGYFSLGPYNASSSTDALLIHANSPFAADVAAGNYTAINATFASVFGAASANQANITLKYILLPSWDSVMENIVVQDIPTLRGVAGGRLLDAEALTNHAEALIEMGTVNSAGASFNFVGGGVIAEIDPDSVALHPYWRKTLVSYNIGASWASSTSPADAVALQAQVTARTQELAQLVGEDAGAYTNEADANEPRWQEVFWGSHYPRLLQIKKTVDPKGVFTCNRCVGSEL